MSPVRRFVRAFKYVILRGDAAIIFVWATLIGLGGAVVSGVAGEEILPHWFVDVLHSEKPRLELLYLLIPPGLFLLFVFSCRFLARWVDYNRSIRPE